MDRGVKARPRGRAVFCLGTLDREGSGVPQSDREAAEYLTQSAKQGHVEAAARLGWRYKLGHGVIRRAIDRHQRAPPCAGRARPTPRAQDTPHALRASAVLRNSSCPPSRR